MEQETRKERERHFKQKEIVQASVTLFAEKGFSTTTMEDIAVSAEFGKGTIYNYFSSKEEIYFAILKDFIDGYKLIVNDLDKSYEDEIEFIKRFTYELVEYCVKNQDAFLLFVREVAQLNHDIIAHSKGTFEKDLLYINKVLTKNFERGFKNKTIKKYNVKKIVDLFTLMIFPYIHHLVLCEEQKINIKAETDLILSVFFEGILV